MTESLSLRPSAVSQLAARVQGCGSRVVGIASLYDGDTTRARLPSALPQSALVREFSACALAWSEHVAAAGRSVEGAGVHISDVVNAFAGGDLGEADRLQGLW